MTILLDLCALILRVIRSSNGDHARPYAVWDEATVHRLGRTVAGPEQSERPTRARTRIRPYIPAPTVPPEEGAQHVHGMDMDADTAPVLVRPYVLAEERRREQERADRDRLGIAVLMDLGTVSA